MRTYIGVCLGTTTAAEHNIIVADGDCTRPLGLRLDLARHSPTGFSWSYAGSGPAQAALAMLADVLGDDDRALRIYQDYKMAVLARMPQAHDWTLTEDEIRATVTRLEAERRAAGTLRPLPCHACEGIGFLDGADVACPVCAGSGERAEPVEA